MIGDTLFVDGTPYTVCGVCGVHVKKYDGQRIVVAGRDKRHTEVKAYKVTLLIKWLREETLEIDPLTGFQTIVTKAIPILKQVPSCFDCWDHQDRERQQEEWHRKNTKGYKPRMVAYDIRELAK